MVVISNVFVVFTLFAMLCGMTKQLLMQYYEPIYRQHCSQALNISRVNIHVQNTSWPISEFCITIYWHIHHKLLKILKVCLMTDWPAGPGSYPRLLTQIADGVVSLLRIQHLLVDVGGTNAIAEYVASDHDVLFPRRCPAHHNRVGQWTDSQRCWLTRHSRFWRQKHCFIYMY